MTKSGKRTPNQVFNS